MNEENILTLTKDKQRFLEWSKKIEDKFDGPSAYFYLKTINKLKEAEKDYEMLLNDDSFLESIYATLACWGMHRMDKNTRMSEFDLFRKSIIQNKEKFVKLSNENLRDSNLDALKEDILIIFNSLKVMARDNSPKFVANSKIMHFLLPNLIPPMDKGHIVYFFYGRTNDKNKKYVPMIKDEEKIFWEILIKFQWIARILNLNEKDLINNWDTSIPKIIDNAIIGFNISKKEGI